MMIPGREVKMLILSLLAARSISTRDDAGVGEALLQVLLEHEVLVEEVRVLLLRVPAAAPGLVEAEPEPDGMDFLTHLTSLSFSRHVHGEVRGALDDLVGAAHGRRPHALLRRALVRVGRARRTRSSSSSRRFWFLSATFTALAMAERRVFSMSRATDFLVKRRMDSASPAFLPRMRSSTSPAFWAEVRMYLAVAFTSSMAYPPTRFGRARAGAAGRARDLGHLLDLATSGP